MSAALDDAPVRPRGILRPPEHPVRILVTGVGVALVILVVGLVLRHHAIDLRLSKDANSLHTGTLGAITTLVYHVISPIPAIVETAVIAVIILLVTRSLPKAFAFAIVVAGGWLPSAIVKAIVHRHRPPAALMPHPYHPIQHDASYPSGHAVFLVTLLIALILVTRDSRWGAVVAILGSVVVFLAICAVVIDAVHYPTDVIASTIWAIAVAPAVHGIWTVWLAPRIPVLGTRPRPAR